MLVHHQQCRRVIEQYIGTVLEDGLDSATCSHSWLLASSKLQWHTQSRLICVSLSRMRRETVGSILKKRCSADTRLPARGRHTGRRLCTTNNASLALIEMPLTLRRRLIWRHLDHSGPDDIKSTSFIILSVPEVPHIDHRDTHLSILAMLIGPDASK